MHDSQYKLLALNSHCVEKDADNQILVQGSNPRIDNGVHYCNRTLPKPITAHHTKLMRENKLLYIRKGNSIRGNHQMSDNP